MPTDESRYELVSRRAFLRRTATVGLAAAIPGVILAACGSDTDVFAVAAASATTSTTLPPTTRTTPATTTSTTTTSTTTTQAPVVGTILPDNAEFVVDFAYRASDDGGGGAKNPYVAVWIEDEAGDLVATVALWFLQSTKGLKWLKDLRRWSTVDGSDVTIDVVSSATRSPGTYSVVWDGMTAAGNRAAQGTYYVAIEAAREHGPYSLIRQPITLGSEAFSASLDPEGELENAAVSLVLA